MFRSIGIPILAASAAVAMAQNAPFTIVRPADGSRVREKIHVLIPKGSVPPGGYVGIFMNDKFIEATVPPVRGKYYDYTIDTKGRGIPDGPFKLEAVLYVDYNEQPRIVDRSSVNVTVANRANINIPASGLLLRYGFRPGREWVYTMQQRVTMDTISEAQNKPGGRPAELPLDFEKVRLLYAVDNAYGDGSAMVRIQPLPASGKDYTILTSTAQEGQRVFYSYDMAPVYMRLTSTGRQLYGSVPVYIPLEGTSGEGTRTDLYAVFPLPSLPEKAVRPGDAWASRFQESKIDLQNIFNQTSLVRNFPARGEFVGVEWEMGHPTAKLRNTIAAGTVSKEDKQLAAQGSPLAGERLSVNETIWFALDTREVIKIVRDETVQTKVQGGGFGGPGGFGPPSGYGAGPGGYPGGRSGGADDLGGPAYGGGDRITRPFGQRGGPAGLGGPQRPGGMGGFPGMNRGGAPAQQSQFVRVRIQQIFTLEE